MDRWVHILIPTYTSVWGAWGTSSEFSCRARRGRACLSHVGSNFRIQYMEGEGSSYTVHSSPGLTENENKNPVLQWYIHIPLSFLL